MAPFFMMYILYLPIGWETMFLGFNIMCCNLREAAFCIHFDHRQRKNIDDFITDKLLLFFISKIMLHLHYRSSSLSLREMLFYYSGVRWLAAEVSLTMYSLILLVMLFYIL